MGDALDDVWWREEILQAMYWMKGEGIADEVDAGTLVSFLSRHETEIVRHLERLRESGDLVKTDRGTYALSSGVLGEAADLFSRGFSDMVNSAEHGSQCSRPDCLCHSLGPDECLDRTDEEHAHT